MIVTEEVGIERAKFDGAGNAGLAMELCRGLVSHQMVRNAEHPLRHNETGRFVGGPRDAAALFRNREGTAEVANSRKVDIQTGKKLKLVLPIVERLRKR